MVEQWLTVSRDRIEIYWDQFSKQPLPQYVECDFVLVAQALVHCQLENLVDGRLFLEWGCGFAVVTGVAAVLGFDAVGIEAEPFLCTEARHLLQSAGVEAEVWQGNFLPVGARKLALDTDPLVSLSHHLPPAYGDAGMGIDDFAIIFVYPWPGEEHFMRSVFAKYARSGALLVMFRGPFQMELYRKS